MTEHDKIEKDDRRERYQRRRGRASVGASDDSPRRRRTPYKREQTDYDDWEEEFEGWSDEDI